MLVQIFALWYNYLMANKAIWKKRSKSVLLAYLILAIIGSSAISMAEYLYFEYSSNDNLSSGSYFSPISQTFDWLAGDILKIRKSRDNSNSQLRNKLLRVFTLDGTISMAIHLSEANLKIKNDNIQVIRNLVLLKLRI